MDSDAANSNLTMEKSYNLVTPDVTMDAEAIQSHSRGQILALWLWHRNQVSIFVVEDLKTISRYRGKLSICEDKVARYPPPHTKKNNNKKHWASGMLQFTEMALDQVCDFKREWVQRRLNAELIWIVVYVFRVFILKHQTQYVFIRSRIVSRSF